MKAPLTYIVCALWLTACSTPQFDSWRSDRLAVQRGGKSAVLVRIAATWNGTPTDPRKIFMDPAEFTWRPRLEDLDRQDSIFGKPIAGSPEPDLGKWLCFVVEPGSYFLPDLARQGVGFWFYVPKGQPVVYPGTLIYRCSGKRFMQSRWVHAAEASITSEPEAALTTAERAFGQRPSISTIHSYGGLVSKETAQKILPLLVAVSGNPALQSPDWKQRRRIAAPLQLLGSGGGGGEGAAAIFILYSAYYPLGRIIGSELAAADARKWGACASNLAEQVQAFNPASVFQQRLAQRLGSDKAVETEKPLSRESAINFAKERNCRGLIEGSIEEIQLAESVKNKFHLKILIRIRASDAANGEVIYDAIMRYGEPVTGLAVNHVHGPLAHEMPLPGGALARGMDEYCRAEGGRDLINDLNTAIEQSIDRFLHDLQIDPQKLRMDKQIP